MPRVTRRTAPLALALAASLLGAVGGCATGSDGPAGTSGHERPTQAPPATATPPTEAELGPGWDEQPDTPVVPDAELPQAELDALLRVTATGPDGAGACGPDDVAYLFTFSDAAAGHRYGSLDVTNTSAGACTVSGYPGLGARGAWGHAFELVVEQTETGLDGSPTGTPVVELAPGASARSAVEWTGELAGAESEPVSSLVVQLAQGQPARLVAPGETDIGMLTTVRIGALLPAG